MIGAWDGELFAAYKGAPDGPRKRLLGNRLYIENEPLVKTLVAQMLGQGQKRPGQRVPAALGRIHRSELVESWDDAMGIAGIAFAKFLRDYDPTQGKISFFLGMKIKYELQCLIERSTNIKTPRDTETELVPRGFDRFDIDGDLERAMSASGLEAGGWDDLGEEDEVPRVEIAMDDAPAPKPPRSAVEDFLERRCSWSPPSRVARDPLVALFERHGSALGLVVRVDALLVAVVARGARPVRMRTAWSSSARGFAGLRVSQSDAA